jgi:hypothetical protein
MIPNERERIIDAGTALILTCVYAFEDEFETNNYNFSWEIPEYITKNAEVRIIILNSTTKQFFPF